MTTGNRSANSRDALTASPCPETTTAGPAVGGHELHTLSPDECFDLLEPGGVGRVGFASAAGVVMLPVNFAITEKTIIVRTAPDTQLAAHADGPVSFEVDRIDEVRHEGWSVLVRGRGHTVTEERAVKRLEDRTQLQPWAAGARDVYVRIVPNQISGRRI
jgi:nitroimidazol reductase NimA-like FMN-containing flavoprotein (pyridoxamine 5'-phosphate oxidase superfamily)